MDLSLLELTSRSQMTIQLMDAFLLLKFSTHSTCPALSNPTLTGGEFIRFTELDRIRTDALRAASVEPWMENENIFDRCERSLSLSLSWSFSSKRQMMLALLLLSHLTAAAAPVSVTIGGDHQFRRRE